MYTYADRMRAVELYIRLGLRVRATIRQLGYPTKNALKGWYQQYLKHQDLPENKAPRAQKYSLEQRQAAVAYYRAHDRCIAATMRALGYPGRGTLTAWVRQDCPETSKSIVGRAWPAAKPDALMCEGVVQLCARQSTALLTVLHGDVHTAGKTSAALSICYSKVRHILQPVQTPNFLHQSSGTCIPDYRASEF